MDLWWLGGSLADSGDVVLIIDAADANEINDTLARDPWNESGLIEIKDILPSAP
jgi:hypothetical protein